MPPDVALVVDLSAEFDEPPEIRRGRKYVSLPILDGGVPDADALRRAVDEVEAARGTVFVHCAQGHGRSGFFSTAVFLARGLASTPAEAIEKIQKIRQGCACGPSRRGGWRSSRRRSLFDAGRGEVGVLGLDAVSGARASSCRVMGATGSHRRTRPR